MGYCLPFDVAPTELIPGYIKSLLRRYDVTIIRVNPCSSAVRFVFACIRIYSRFVCAFPFAV